MDCVDGDGTALTAEGTLTYERTEPYAVRLWLRTQDTPHSWLISRDLLLDGLNLATGFGDVRVWPSVGTDRRPVLMLELNSAASQLLIQISASEARRFLRRTLKLVPLGTESAYLDLDGLLAALRG